MNREILFRGKRKDNGQWVYGNLISAEDGSFILEAGHSCLFQEPEYHTQGMGCGLEDQNIQNRYDAMAHGWEKAIERVMENYLLFVEVISETVGQLSGHEEKIFEGDIVNYVTGNPKRYVNCIVRFGEYETYTKIVDNGPTHNSDAGEVENHIGFYLEDGTKKIPINSLWIKKLGNIFDNPELLTKDKT